MLSRIMRLHSLLTSSAGIGAGHLRPGKRQIVHLFPPSAQVDHVVQAAFGISELAFVDHQAGVHRAFAHQLHDFVEWGDYRFEIRLIEFKGR